MDISELRSALSKHFQADGFTEIESDGLDLVLIKDTERWGFALCPDREEGMAYLGAFEAAMQKIVDAHQATETSLRLGLGIAFGSAAAGQNPSYRRALKKYSNSILFEDMNVHVFLVQNNAEVMDLPPSSINLFLRDLDRWIAGQKI
ncbi:MAG: hypothetical protein M1347_07645 [Chloroflexi bacterium]|nr:hypothetical protein [Chloroflexota bacterium]